MSVISIDIKSNPIVRIMEKTPFYILDNELAITVPNNYSALLLVDGETPRRVKPCQKKKVLRLYGEEFDGRYICALFISQKALPTMSWGIGNLELRYPCMDNDVCRVGANGTFFAEITDHARFFWSFPKGTYLVNQTATIGTITTAFREIASKILVQLFTEADEPILNPNFMLDEMNLRLKNTVCDREIESLPGIRFISASAQTLCINEDDVAKLKTRMTAEK